jgi:hypothetical protein
MKCKTKFFALRFLEWIKGDQSRVLGKRAPPGAMLFEYFCSDVSIILESQLKECQK